MVRRVERTSYATSPILSPTLILTFPDMKRCSRECEQKNDRQEEACVQGRTNANAPH